MRNLALAIAVASLFSIASIGTAVEAYAHCPNNNCCHGNVCH